MKTLTNQLLMWLLLLITCGTACGQEAGRRKAGRQATCWTLEIEAGARPLRLDFEYSLEFLRSHCPGGADPAVFSWLPLPDKTFSEHNLLVAADRTEYVMFHYDEQSDVPQNTAVMLLRKSSEGYFQPVFIAFPELKRYHGHLVSNRRHRLAYTLTMRYDGTGAIRGTYLFDLQGKPRLLRSAHGHRLRREEYKSLQAYQRDRDDMVRAEKLARGEP